MILEGKLEPGAGHQTPMQRAVPGCRRVVCCQMEARESVGSEVSDDVI